MNATSPDNTKKVVALVQEALKGGLPQGVTLKAGPWASNEEPKVILVLDIQDHSLTFNTFAKIVAQGLVAKRRLTPIVEWSGVKWRKWRGSCKLPLLRWPTPRLPGEQEPPSPREDREIRQGKRGDGDGKNGDLVAAPTGKFP